MKKIWKGLGISATITMAMLAATLLLIVISNKFSGIGTDGVFYAGMAKNLVEGGGLSVFGVPHTIYSPLLPLFISALYLWGIPLEMSAHITIIVFALSGITGVYFLGKQMYSERAGILSALFLATNGMYLWCAGVTVSPQFVAGFFALIATLYLLEIEKSQSDKVVVTTGLAGACVGLAYLARPEYFFLIFPVMAWLGAVLRKKLGNKKTLHAVLTAFTTFILVAFPYLLYLHNTLGYWTMSGRGTELAYIVSSTDYEAVDEAAGAGVSTVVAPPVLKNGAIRTALRDVPLLAKRLADGLVNTEHAILVLFGSLGLFFFALGLRYLILEKMWPTITLLLAFLSPIVLVAFAQGGSPNYLVQYFYLITPIIAIGLIRGAKEISEKYALKQGTTNILIAILPLILSVYLLLPLIQNVLFLPDDYREVEYKMIGLWMKDNISNITHETIVSRKPEPAFYAGSLWSIIPNATSTDALCVLMHKRGQHYVVADDRSLPVSRPELVDLLNSEKVKNNFILSHMEEYRGKRAFLYVIHDACSASGRDGR